MNKRDRMLQLLTGQGSPDYVPAGFFLHFPEDCHRGRRAIDKHLAFYRHTDMDMVKIQFECPFPYRPEIQEASDWAKMPVYDRSFYAEQLAVVEGLVDAAKDEALVLVTLYSPFMLAMQTTRRGSAVAHGAIEDHAVEAPDQAKVGLERLTESLLIFVRGCIDLGVDGFYASTQGGEKGRFGDPGVFERVIKPYDLVVQQEINDRCLFNILHVCDYYLPYEDMSPFVDYPGDAVSCSLDLADGKMTAREVSSILGRPFMGGLDRHGVIVDGSQAALRAAVEACLRDAPEGYVLGADCTVPSDIAWDRLQLAIALAHRGR